MGDNVYLGDRDSVRTPMQWSADRNAGFSEANPQRLYLPTIIDPEYSYESVNVAAQLDNPDSLLWWVRRLIALRRRNPVFAHGTIELLAPDNHRVLAFFCAGTRGARCSSWRTSRVRAVRRARPARVPRCAPGRAVRPDLVPRDRRPPVSPHPRAPRVLLARTRTGGGPRRDRARGPAGDGHERVDGAALARKRSPLDRKLPQLLATKRWFGSKGRKITSARVVDSIAVPMPHHWSDDEDMPPAEPARCGVRARRVCRRRARDLRASARVRPRQRRHPHVRREPRGRVVPRRLGGRPTGVVMDAHWLPGYGRGLARFMQRRRRARGELGTLVGVSFGPELTRVADLDQMPVSVLGGEQSNTSLQFDDRLILKTVRRLESGISPEVELGRALTRSNFEHSPPLLGSMEYRMVDGTTATVAVLHDYVKNESDAYSWYATRSAGSSTASSVISTPASSRTPRRIATRSNCSTRNLPSTSSCSRATSSRRSSSSGGAPPTCTSRWPRFPTTARSRRSRSTSWCSAPRTSRCGTPRCGPCAHWSARNAGCPTRPRTRRGSCWTTPTRCSTGCGRCSAAAGRDAHPGARRPPPRPGALDRTRLRLHRLRGRARAPDQPAPDQALAAARRGGHAAVVRLRGPHVDPRRGRPRAGPERGAGAGAARAPQ